MSLAIVSSDREQQVRQKMAGQGAIGEFARVVGVFQEMHAADNVTLQ